MEKSHDYPPEENYGPEYGQQNTRGASVAGLEVPLDQVPKSRWERSWPTVACGAGLFSDGYLNGVS